MRQQAALGVVDRRRGSGGGRRDGRGLGQRQRWAMTGLVDVAADAVDAAISKLWIVCDMEDLPSCSIVRRFSVRSSLAIWKTSPPAALFKCKKGGSGIEPCPDSRPESMTESLNPDVHILDLTIVTPDRPNLILPIPFVPDAKGYAFALKDGSRYRLKFSFVVSSNIVSGLRYTNTVWKTGVR
ncbi:Rho GDP-dissociation inhibitor 1, partial [Ananas comosus]